jgi:hypothetical protein
MAMVSVESHEIVHLSSNALVESGAPAGRCASTMSLLPTVVVARVEEDDMCVSKYDVQDEDMTKVHVGDADIPCRKDKPKIVSTCADYVARELRGNNVAVAALLLQ